MSSGPPIPRKTFTPHQQPERFVRYIIERFTTASELVIDPFVGGGSSASAAASLGRRFLGCDVDAGALMQTRERLSGR